MSTPPSLPDPWGTDAPTPVVAGPSLPPWVANALWAVAAVLSGALAGVAWRVIFGARSTKAWGAEGFFAVNGLLLAILLVLGLVWGVAFLVRPGPVPMHRYVVVLVGVLLADVLAWATGAGLGMPTLTARVVLIAGPLATAAVTTLGAAWHATRAP